MTMTSSTTTRVMQLLSMMLAMASITSAFTFGGQQQHRARITALRDGEYGGSGPGAAKVGSIETLEFKIYADGRVEETVRGIKGGNCNKVTEAINEALGKVVESSPTEELYEQEVVIDQTLTQTDGGANWEGSTPNSW